MSLNLQGKIAFLDHKLALDQSTVRVSVIWMVVIIVVASCGGLLLSWLLPSFDGKELVAWAAPGTFGLSLPAPIKEYFARRQSIVAVKWLREQYALLSSHPDGDLLSLLDARFTSLFDKVAVA